MTKSCQGPDLKGIDKGTSGVMKAFSHDCGEGDMTVYICPNSSHCTLNIGKLPGNYVPKCVSKGARMIFRHRVAQGFPTDLPQATAMGLPFPSAPTLKALRSE